MIPPRAIAAAKPRRLRGGQNPDGYTAIVHFHGMGSQRRYEESCRLIDSLHRYLGSDAARAKSLGRLVGIGARQEPHRIDKDEVVTYVRARHLSAGSREEREIRVYECYWAPAMAGSKSVVGITKWMLLQTVRPVYSLLTPWWERHGLRESMLLELRQDRTKWPEGTREGDFDRMLSHYRSFRRSNPGCQGYFRHFLRLYDRGLEQFPTSRDRMKRLAWRWWRFSFFRELRNAFLLLTLLVTLALSVGGVVWSILQLLHLFAAAAEGNGLLKTLAEMLGDRIKPTFAAAAALGVSLASLLGVTRFLAESMGDVQAWATFAETDETFEKRSKVLKMGSGIMRHVLEDPACGRVVVTSHSLGTSVAFDTLPALVLHNNAYNLSNPIAGPIPLEKISHLVTMGSPIDKIHYFFGGQRSKVISYLDILDGLRMTTARMPFVKNRKPHIHWTNYWDEADAISGPLQSPCERGEGAFDVDDVHVQNYGFPAPARSHNAYFENRTVIDGIFRMTVRNEMNFSNLPLRPNGHGYDYASVLRGPGSATGGRRLWSGAALSVPWILVAALVTQMAGATEAARTTALAAALIAAVLVTAWIATLLHGNREPL
ncbi:hypothetical protein [Pseudooceanicola sp. LIPI14-2-Ac024]|uniref:hypothetical protein n=1 Tax=Pseudooceanicola sp. LIPI14-2-Ac024 TaxID=3344875 RepID=UPI0035CF06DC